VTTWNIDSMRGWVEAKIGDDDFGSGRNRTAQEMVQTRTQLEAKFFKFISSNGPSSRRMSEKNCFFVSGASSLNQALQRSNLLRRSHGFKTIDRGITGFISLPHHFFFDSRSERPLAILVGHGEFMSAFPFRRQQDIERDEVTVRKGVRRGRKIIVAQSHMSMVD
jgi:hypothetical protein